MRGVKDMQKNKGPRERAAVDDGLRKLRPDHWIVGFHFDDFEIVGAAIGERIRASSDGSYSLTERKTFSIIRVVRGRAQI